MGRAHLLVDHFSSRGVLSSLTLCPSFFPCVHPGRASLCLQFGLHRSYSFWLETLSESIVQCCHYIGLMKAKCSKERGVNWFFTMSFSPCHLAASLVLRPVIVTASLASGRDSGEISSFVNSTWHVLWGSSKYTLWHCEAIHTLTERFTTGIFLALFKKILKTPGVDRERIGSTTLEFKTPCPVIQRPPILPTTII